MRTFLGRVAWASAGLVWLSLARAFLNVFVSRFGGVHLLAAFLDVVFVRSGRCFSGLRHCMRFVGHFECVPSTAYGIAGILALVAAAFAPRGLGHFCEPAFIAAMIGDLFAAHRAWLWWAAKTEAEDNLEALVSGASGGDKTEHETHEKND